MKEILNLPDRCHSNHCPPECIRDAFELAFWTVLFGVENSARKQHHTDQQEKYKHG